MAIAQRMAAIAQKWIAPEYRVWPADAGRVGERAICLIQSQADRSSLDVRNGTSAFER